MADTIEISPIFRQAMEDEKNRVPLASTPTATAPAPPGPLERFWNSVVSSNLYTGIKSGLLEWYHRPEAIHDMQMGLAAERRIRAGHAQPGDQELLDKGAMAADAHFKASAHTAPMFTEPALEATTQSQQGNYAGAAGTLVGGYGSQAALGAAAPYVARAGKAVAEAAPRIVKGARAYAQEPVAQGTTRIPLTNIRVTMPPTRLGRNTATGAGIGTALTPVTKAVGLPAAVGPAAGTAVGAGGTYLVGAVKEAGRMLRAKPDVPPVWASKVPEPTVGVPPAVEPVPPSPMGLMPSGRTVPTAAQRAAAAEPPPPPVRPQPNPLWQGITEPGGAPTARPPVE